MKGYGWQRIPAGMSGDVAPVPPTVSPITIFGANLVLWYTADRGVTLSGSSVTGWADQSGNNLNAGQRSGTSPTFSSTGFNSNFPGISFTSGSTAELISPNFNINTNAAAIFTAGSYVSTSQSFEAYTYGPYATDNSTSTTGILWFIDSFGGAYFGAQDSIDYIATGISGGPQRFSAVFNGPGGTFTGYINNVAGNNVGSAINNTLGTSSSCFAVGANNKDTSITMTVAEVFLTNIAPTLAQRQAVDGYLRAHWGM